MKDSIGILKELMSRGGEDWKKKLDAYLQGNQTDNEEEELYLSFLGACEEDVIENKADILKKIEKMVNNDLLYGDLMGRIKNSLEAYYDMEPLRVLEVKDYQMALRLVDHVFEKAIVRFDPDVDEAYGEFGLDSNSTYIEIISVFVSLCEFIICKNLHRNAMVDVIYRNIRLSKKMCNYIADKIDNYFDQIRMKLILEKMYED